MLIQFKLVATYVMLRYVISMLGFSTGQSVAYACHRYVCDFLREHYADNVEVRVRYLGDLMRLDESCLEVLEFVQLSIERGI